MPAKNVIKEYKENTYYHLYNRGVAKNDIFSDDQDYKIFLSYLKLYLSPKNPELSDFKTSPSRILKNYSSQIDLLCFCLMPNHFHLLVFQKDLSTINFFTKSLLTKYSMYFNKKHHRIGSLFQGPYKAVEVTNENQLIYLSKYIHLNPTSPTRREPVGLLTTSG